MDKMREGIQRRARRMQENLQQSVGLGLRSEKRDELQCISHIEHRNQKIISAVKNTRLNLQNCIRSVNKEELVEKRKRRLDEYGLWLQLLSDSKEIENVFPKSESSVLADVLRIYGEVIGVLLEEKVRSDQLIEKGVIEAFGKYVEEEKAISKAKEKLTRTVVDVEVCRKRKLGNHDETKAHEIQEEFDSLQLKLENYKDTAFSDIYTLLSKEAEVACVYRSLISNQLEYHRLACDKLESILPEIEQRIASYSKRPVFGNHLEDHLKASNRSIAIVLEVCCSALVRFGFREKGLFRINGNNNRIRRMKAAFDAHQIHGGSAELAEYVADPHSICSVLKSYLRELPEPLMTFEFHTEWIRIARMEAETRKQAIRELLLRFPEANRLNLAYIIRFLQVMLAYEDQTKMNVGNLSIVFGPNLFDSRKFNEPENMFGARIVETLLTHADFFFANDVFDFSSPLIESYSQRLVETTGGFEGNRIIARSTQLQIDANSSQINNNHQAQVSTSQENSPQSIGTPPQTQLQSSPQLRNVYSSQAGSIRSRPKMPAPPPPNQVNMVNDVIVDDISCSLEHLNKLGAKSPSLASNDSMAEYGYLGSEVREDVGIPCSMSQSVDEGCSLLRPSRPPPPTINSDFPPASFRPVSYVSAVSTQEIVPPPRKSFPNLAVDNRTIVRLESETVQYSPSLVTTIATVPVPKPRLPAKPKATNELKNNEITKL